MCEVISKGSMPIVAAAGGAGGAAVAAGGVYFAELVGGFTVGVAATGGIALVTGAGTMLYMASKSLDWDREKECAELA